MAHPWIFESNFEAGTNAEWDSETDTGSLLDFPHFSKLARWERVGMPYHGAFCMRVQMGDTNDHTLIEGDIDIADTVTRYSSFYLNIALDAGATSDDTFNIYEVQGTANAVENAVGLRVTAATDKFEIGVGNTAPTVFASISKGVWHHVELVSVIQTGGTGTATLWLDGAQVAQVTTLTNTAVLRGVLGTQDTLSTTTGTILFDEFRFDDGQIYPNRNRWATQRTFTKNAHFFVGPGSISSVTLLEGTTCHLYDTDTANVNDAQGFVVELTSSTHTSATGPFTFDRGCYVVLTGTTPRASITLVHGAEICVEMGVTKPVFYSEAGMRHYGLVRNPRPQNV